MNIVIPSFIVFVAACFIGFGIRHEIVYNLYVNYAYYFVLFGCFIWLYKLTNLLPGRKDLLKFFKIHCLAILVSIVAVIMFFLTTKPELRILADETNLLSIAKAMYEDHTSVIITEQTECQYGLKDRISYVIDKRPLLFPFSLSVLHSFLGYSYRNAFLLNGLAAVGSLFLMYYFTYLYWGRVWGLVSMAFMASFPLLVMYTASAGFEVFNLFWMLLLFVVVSRFFKYKNTQWAEFMLYTALLLAQTRYESALCVFLALFVLFLIIPKEKLSDFSLSVVVYPLLLIHVAWVRGLTYTQSALQVDSLKDAFSWDSFINNFYHFFPFVFGTKKEYGMITFIAVSACLALIIIIYRFFRKNLFNNISNKQDGIILIVFIAIFFILHAFARFFYYWGDLTLPYISRMGIIFIPLLSWLSTYLFRTISFKLKIRKICFLLIPIFLSFYNWPSAGMNSGVKDITLFREFKFIREFLEQEFPNKKEYILVAPTANLYVPLEYNVISHQVFDSRYNDYKENLDNKTWQYIIVIQKINKSSNKILENTNLNNKIKFNIIKEYQLINNDIIKILIYKP